MDIADLEAFIAVVEHNGFRRAADVLFISQPALTRRVNRLEQELGVALLERGAWGLRVTGQGEVLLSGARRVVAALTDARAATIGAGTGTITLGCSATAAGSYLSAFLSTWIPRHPTTRVKMIEDGAGGMRRRLEDHQCDAAIIAAPVPTEFDSRPITPVTIEALLPRAHPLAETHAPLGVHELDGEAVLLNGPSFLSTELFLSACRLMAVQPDIVYECSVGQTLAALAEAGLGIAVVSDTVDRRGFDLPTRPLVDHDGHMLQFELHIAWSRGRSLPLVVHEFIDELAEYISGFGPRVPGERAVSHRYTPSSGEASPRRCLRSGG